MNFPGGKFGVGIIRHIGQMRATVALPELALQLDLPSLIDQLGVLRTEK